MFAVQYARAHLREFEPIIRAEAAPQLPVRLTFTRPHPNRPPMSTAIFDVDCEMGMVQTVTNNTS